MTNLITNEQVVMLEGPSNVKFDPEFYPEEKWIANLASQKKGNFVLGDATTEVRYKEYENAALFPLHIATNFANITKVHPFVNWLIYDNFNIASVETNESIAKQKVISFLESHPEMDTNERQLQINTNVVYHAKNAILNGTVLVGIFGQHHVTEKYAPNQSLKKALEQANIKYVLLTNTYSSPVEAQNVESAQNQRQFNYADGIFMDYARMQTEKGIKAYSGPTTNIMNSIAEKLQKEIEIPK